MTQNDASSPAKGPPPEVIEFYTQFAEEARLGTGSCQLEFERTRELLERLLPPPPGRIVDIGGAAGAYAFWLAAPLALNPTLDAQIVRMRHGAVADGHYRNTTGNPRYFVTAYFHRPADLAEEMTAVGCEGVRVFGVEGPGWLLPDFEARWRNDDSRRHLLAVARLLEREESLLGVSAHLLAVGVKGPAQRR